MSFPLVAETTALLNHSIQEASSFVQSAANAVPQISAYIPHMPKEKSSGSASNPSSSTSLSQVPVRAFSLMTMGTTSLMSFSLVSIIFGSFSLLGYTSDHTDLGNLFALITAGSVAAFSTAAIGVSSGYCFRYFQKKKIIFSIKQALVNTAISTSQEAQKVFFVNILRTHYARKWKETVFNTRVAVGGLLGSGGCAALFGAIVIGNSVTGSSSPKIGGMDVLLIPTILLSAYTAGMVFLTGFGCFKVRGVGSEFRELLVETGLKDYESSKTELLFKV